MTISREEYEQHLTHVKCDVKACENQALFIEEIRNLDSPLNKKLELNGYLVLCKSHYQALFGNSKRKGTIISFMTEKGDLTCNRCSKSWRNILQNHRVPVTCKLCTNKRWNKPYIKERMNIGDNV